MEAQAVKVLDHGYLRLIETWGRLDPDCLPGDEAIIAAARMSTGKGFQGWGPVHICPDHPEDGMVKWACLKCGKWEDRPGDEKLLKYLYDNRHATPFEMCGMTIEVQAPIFVFREWHRHRTQSYNEMSARYTPLPDMNYIPTVERLMINAAGGNKQAGTIKDASEMTEETARWFQDGLREEYEHAEALYQVALRRGVPKELARVHLPVGRYSRMRASCNLRNWLGFLTLRMDSKAQYEIRQYANVVGSLISQQFPKTWSCYEGK